MKHIAAPMIGGASPLEFWNSWCTL